MFGSCIIKWALWALYRTPVGILYDAWDPPIKKFCYLFIFISMSQINITDSLHVPCSHLFLKATKKVLKHHVTSLVRALKTDLY